MEGGGRSVVAKLHTLGISHASHGPFGLAKARTLEEGDEVRWHFTTVAEHTSAMNDQPYP